VLAGTNDSVAVVAAGARLVDATSPVLVVAVESGRLVDDGDPVAAGGIVSVADWALGASA
jgi:hypothetical protein